MEKNRKQEGKICDYCGRRLTLGSFSLSKEECNDCVRADMIGDQDGGSSKEDISTKE